MKVIHFEKPIVQAHRGASGYEHMNTIPAFDKAVELKADAIELDIRKTKDGKIIVVHDPDYKGKKICEYDYEELVEVTKEDGFIMPLFIDVLKKYKGVILLDIEIKEDGYTKEIMDMVLSVLDYNEFNVRSFNENVIRTVKELYPKTYAILLIGLEHPKHGIFSRLAELFPKAKVKRTLCDAVSPHYRLIRFGYVRRMHRKKKAVLAWTVNDESLMREMFFKKHVDGIVSNYPDIAMKVRDEYLSK